MNTITVKRAGTDRPATNEELEAAVEGRPLPPAWPKGGPLPHWITTHTGRQVIPAALAPEDIDIEDIAHALANICRFGGHCREFYSVAQHSVYVSMMVRHPWRLHALLHDAHEAYVGDVVAPFKRSLPDYCVHEYDAEQAVWQRFGLKAGWWRGPDDHQRALEMEKRVKAAIHQADRALCAVEYLSLLPAGAPFPDGLPQPAHDLTIRPWAPARAKEAFLARFSELDAIRFCV